LTWSYKSAALML